MKFTIDTSKKEITIYEPVKIKDLISELEKFNAEKDWSEYTIYVDPPQQLYVPAYPIWPTYPTWPTLQPSYPTYPVIY